MKKYIVSLIVLASFVAISCGTAESSNTVKSNTDQVQTTFTNVSVTDLYDAMASGVEIIVLDVRTPGEVAQGKLETSQNIDVNNSNFSSLAKSLDKSKTVYVYCRSGVRSQKASKILIDMGFTDVRNVEGGFIGWVQKGYKSVN